MAFWLAKHSKLTASRCRDRLSLSRAGLKSLSGEWGQANFPIHSFFNHPVPGQQKQDGFKHVHIVFIE